jgi:hypothetical protein
VTVERCFAGVCLIPLAPNGPKFFGFSEFLAGLALMILAWTIADARYRFRVSAAPIPLRDLTFSIVTAIGVLTLLTDLWRAQGWLAPQGGLLTSASWQALLASFFFLTFLSWTWFAFISPPKFGRLNAKRYARTAYRFILKGAPAELAVIADELAHSARALVRHATDRDELENHRLAQSKGRRQPNQPKVEAYANDLLLL